MSVAWIAIFLMSVVIHEVCHGCAAYALGDPTAKDRGRLTLNPLKHLDPFWTVILPGLLFFSTQGRFMIGMAKPVPVNFSRLRNPKRDMIWVALAGPAANILMAWGLGLLWKGFGILLGLYGAYFNLGLAIFNLIPIPPLDGSRILAGLLPVRMTVWMFRYERFGFLLILLLYFTGHFSDVLLPGINFFAALFGLPKLAIEF